MFGNKHGESLCGYDLHHCILGVRIETNGCALCKPHKHGWAPKKKPKVMSFEKQTDREIKHATGCSGIIR